MTDSGRLSWVHLAHARHSPHLFSTHHGMFVVACVLLRPRLSVADVPDFLAPDQLPDLRLLRWKVWSLDIRAMLRWWNAHLHLVEFNVCQFDMPRISFCLEPGRR